MNACNRLIHANRAELFVKWCKGEESKGISLTEGPLPDKRLEFKEI